MHSFLTTWFHFGNVEFSGISWTAQRPRLKINGIYELSEPIAYILEMAPRKWILLHLFAFPPESRLFPRGR